MAKTTDGSNNPGIVHLLRYRAFDLFGQLPAGQPWPQRPERYDELEWHLAPRAVENLEAELRKRLAAAPKSRPAIAARQIGWWFSNG